MDSMSWLEIEKIQNDITLTCKDAWTLQHAKKIDILLTQNIQKNTNITLDFKQISDFDTHGIICLLSFIYSCEEEKCQIHLQNMNENLQKLYEVCKKNYEHKLKTFEKRNAIKRFLYDVGLLTMQSKDTLIRFFSFVGGLSDALGEVVLNPWKLRFKATLYHVQNSGLGAVPIIFLTSFLIGVVVAFQGAVQLEKFGANIFIVEMVSISVARELAPLLTAIVIAGRSSSAFTAQLGAMKITEEIDAMQTMGFSVWQFLIIPRVFALMISLPLLVFFADAISILGGMVVASAQLGISFDEFLLRMQESVEMKHFIIGFVKAPIFGWIIAVIGCFRGFQISSSTESVGKYTTISVVNAIFWVIAMDAIISVILTELEL
jgi:phospholipid/cholesterol/gamma-HCH transport system permease protein